MSVSTTQRRTVTAVSVIGALTVVTVLVFTVLPRAIGRGALLGSVGVPVAFIVGVVSFFSPCVLPLLPGYLSFVSGLSGEQLEGEPAKRRVIAGTLLFVLGFATVFTVLGATASFVGSFFLDNLTLINRIAGAIVILMGTVFLVPGLIGFMQVERRPLMARAKPGVAGAFPLGLAFAVGWTPCVGPGLGAILTLGAREGSVARGAILLFSFSLGFGMWFVIGGVATRRALAASKWLRQRARRIETIGGVFLIVIGILLVTDTWNTLLAPLRRLINTFVPPV